MFLNSPSSNLLECHLCQYCNIYDIDIVVGNIGNKDQRSMYNSFTRGKIIIHCKKQSTVHQKSSSTISEDKTEHNVGVILCLTIPFKL